MANLRRLYHREHPVRLPCGCYFSVFIPKAFSPWLVAEIIERERSEALASHQCPGPHATTANLGSGPPAPPLG